MLVFWFGNSIKKIILTKIFKNFSSDEYLQQSIRLKEITTLLETVNKLIQLKKKKKRNLLVILSIETAGKALEFCNMVTFLLVFLLSFSIFKKENSLLQKHVTRIIQKRFYDNY